MTWSLRKFLLVVLALVCAMSMAPTSTAQFGAAEEREVRDRYPPVERIGGERPHERSLRESIVGDAVKNALADVLREKAEGGGSHASPRTSSAASTASAAPSAATREFSYTSIKFKSSDSADGTTMTRDGNTDFVDSLLATEAKQAEQAELEQRPDPQSLTLDTSALESQLNAKLAAIQQEMSELEELKRAIAQLEGTSSTRKLQMLNEKFDFATMPSMPKPFAERRANSAAAQAKSKFSAKYPDTGIPGWDPLLLIDKKGAFLQDNLATLQRNSQEKAARLNILMTEALAMGADNIATIVGQGGDRQVVRSDVVRSFLDALVLEGQEKVGKLQEFFLQLMEKKEDRVEALLDKIY